MMNSWRGFPSYPKEKGNKGFVRALLTPTLVSEAGVGPNSQVASAYCRTSIGNFCISSDHIRKLRPLLIRRRILLRPNDQDLPGRYRIFRGRHNPDGTMKPVIQTEAGISVGPP